MTSREHLSQMLLFAIRGDIKNYYIDNLYFYSNEIINSNDDEHLNIPKTLNLYQNYPNPFNPSTNIQFSIPKTSTVSLTIFNAIGQKVATLVDSQLSPGTYTMALGCLSRLFRSIFLPVEFQRECTNQTNVVNQIRPNSILLT